MRRVPVRQRTARGVNLEEGRIFLKGMNTDKHR